MKINGSSKINDDGGDYLVLIDYGTEGFSVLTQKQTAKEAFDVMKRNTYGSPMTIVKLVDTSELV